MPLLHMRRKAVESWEALCHQCGLCCYERTEVAGGVRIDLRRPCPYLDTNTRRCTLTLLHALFGRRMPLNCGYVRHYRRWMR